MSTEQVFRSPGFFEREIDLSERKDEITGVPSRYCWNLYNWASICPGYSWVIPGFCKQVLAMPIPMLINLAHML